MTVDTSVPRSRRSVLAAAVGGLAGLVGARMAMPDRAQASAGDPLIIGSEANNAGSADTQLQVTSDIVAFKLLQNGPGTALMGYAASASGPTRGVYGRTDSPNGYGVQGRNSGPTGGGAAIHAIGLNNHGVDATTDSGASNAVRGVNMATSGLGSGVYGFRAGDGIGVRGYSATGYGVYGHTSSGFGVYGNGSNGWAGYFIGRVHVSGTLSKSAGAFKIDHPLDPANKYLSHSFVESPDMLNIYNGTAILDAKGQARVALPGYFEALNRDVRYQLTAVGSAAPDLHVRTGVVKGQFRIAGGTPSLEVSWQVTAIRKDAYAEAHRIVVEEAKPPAERGLYLHPELHGQPAEKGFGRRPWPEGFDSAAG